MFRAPTETGFRRLEYAFLLDGIPVYGQESMSQGLKPILWWPLMSGLKPGPISETTATAKAITARCPSDRTRYQLGTAFCNVH